MGQMLRKTNGESENSYRCLVVDDDAMDRKIATRLLHETGENVNIALAETIGSARQMLISNAYDILLIDHHLPDGFGGTFLSDCIESRLIRWGRAYLLTSIPDHASGLLCDPSSRTEILDKQALTTEVMSRILASCDYKPQDRTMSANH